MEGMNKITAEFIEVELNDTPKMGYCSTKF